jgi:hypothetical protein
MCFTEPVDCSAYQQCQRSRRECFHGPSLGSVSVWRGGPIPYFRFNLPKQIVDPLGESLQVNALALQDRQRILPHLEHSLT